MSEDSDQNSGDPTTYMILSLWDLASYFFLNVKEKFFDFIKEK